MKLFFMILFLGTDLLFSHNADDILGYWYASMPSYDMPIVIEFFKYKDMYYAYGFGWKDPLYIPKNWKDIENPNKNLRNRDICGMVFVFDINFHKQSQKWNEGKMYQYENGKYYYLTAGKLSANKDALYWRSGLDTLMASGKNLNAWIRISQEDLQVYLNNHDKPAMDDVIKTIYQ